MDKVIYPPKFDRLKKLFTKKKNEPEITLDIQQLLGFFQQSGLASEMKRLNSATDTIEMITNYDDNGRMESLTFRFFSKNERGIDSGQN